MNHSIDSIPIAELQRAQYILWNAFDETWSAPMSYSDATEYYARDPELQVSAILADGTTSSDTAPFAEIVKRMRSNQPKDLEAARVAAKIAQAAASRKLTDSAGNSLHSPQTTQAEIVRHLQSLETIMRQSLREQKQASDNMQEISPLVEHALRLYIFVTYGTLYLGSAAALFIGITSGQYAYAVAGGIVLAVTAAIHMYLTSKE